MTRGPLTALVVLLAAACSDPLFSFVGIWAYGSDSKVTQTCDGAAAKDTPLVGDFTLGRDNARLTSPGGNGCPAATLYVTSPNTASLQPFTCTTTSSSGAKTVTTFQTLDIATDGKIMALSGTGETTTDTPPSHCTFTTKAIATKQ